MNLEEERLKELFQHLRVEDEHDAPPFPRDWNGPVNERHAQWRWSSARLTAGAATLILLGAMCVAWFTFFRQSTTRNAPIEAVSSDRPDPLVAAPAVSGPLLAERKVLKPRRRRTFAEPRSATVLISQWSSPTESLLRTPGEQLLKRVPRLDESLISIKPTITNQQD